MIEGSSSPGLLSIEVKIQQRIVKIFSVKSNIHIGRVNSLERKMVIPLYCKGGKTVKTR